MLILPIKTPLLKAGDDLANVLMTNAEIEPGDIIVVSSKAIATAEDAAMDLHTITPSDEAKKYAKLTGKSAEFCQAVIDETTRMNGSVAGHCPSALLTYMRPEGLKRGMILAPNAGLDQSNVQGGWAIGWPRNPVQSALNLRKTMGKKSSDSSVSSDSSDSLGVIISDSCCRPARLGVTAFSLVCCGIDPIQSKVGTADLFGKKLSVTNEAIADQLATAANAVMGNADQSTPAAIIRDHGLPMTDFCGWVDGIEPEEDLFSCLFR